MYVIFKGAIQIKKKMYEGVNMLQGSPQDGEVFGELALFRYNE